MTTSVFSFSFSRQWTLRRLLANWSSWRARARQLRRLDELPEYLLRDVGLDHLTREERSHLGKHRFLRNAISRADTKKI
ncbi:DUF1127 domain-containing protein [Yoonia sediminilitoris]|uniref:Uncharacterized protein DUF1127 n=1 Tax=Yoonia sediminilitoris TaxID=1286148 RepID=A0A2T6K6U0_9RHOB|nr:uncharacterized protein DUF1127 [Yoonia sediminilitoris]RCW89865.1 uncharacterized protein DUF1127 [Yoonia sediminilitoris]